MAQAGGPLFSVVEPSGLQYHDSPLLEPTPPCLSSTPVPSGPLCTPAPTRSLAGRVDNPREERVELTMGQLQLRVMDQVGAAPERFGGWCCVVAVT